LNQEKQGGLPRDVSAMTEEEQLHYALQMSMAQSASESVSGATTEKQSTPVDAEMKDVNIIKQFRCFSD
jgi:hypothetical protein